MSTGKRRSVFVPCTVFLFGAGAVALQIAASGARRPDAPDRPILLIEDTQWNLGEVIEGSTCHTTLVITNRGTLRLVVNEKICALCGSEALPTMIVSPGQTKEVTLTWETDGMSGSIQQSRTFTCNDPQQPSFTLSVLAVVVSSQTADAVSPVARPIIKPTLSNVETQRPDDTPKHRS